MDTNIDLIYDRRSYFGMSDTNLQIYGDETRLSYLWQGIELNNLNKKQTVQSVNKQDDLNIPTNSVVKLLQYYHGAG